MFPTFFFKVTQMVISHLLNKTEQLVIEIGGLFDLLPIMSIHLTQSCHVLDVLAFHLAKLGQKLNDALVHGITFIFPVHWKRSASQAVSLILASVHPLFRGSINFADLEPLTGELGSTSATVGEALILDLDVELSDLVGMVNTGRFFLQLLIPHTLLPTKILDLGLERLSQRTN